jgi:hypothetical protein
VNAITERRRAKSYQRHVVPTRYTYERTWSVATYLSPIPASAISAFV